MKLHTLLVTSGSLLGLITASTCFAQIKEFTGASVYGSTGYNSWSTEWSNTKYNTSSLTAETATSAGFPLFLGMDYTWAMSDVNSLGLSVERNFIKSSNGSSNIYQSGSYKGGGEIVVDNSYQVSILPGLLIDKNTLIYGKVGYYSAVMTLSFPSDGASDSLTQTGYSLGAGVKALFHTPSYGNNFYVFGETNYRIANSLGQRFYFDKLSGDFKLGGMNVLVGLGMHF
jgi:hypothetical protein